MTRVIEQNLTFQALDTDGVMAEATDVTGPFPIALPLDGAYASTNQWNGVAEVELGSGGLYPTLTFTLGLTGSVADVTIVGRDQNGNPQTEVITMPGASAAATTTGYWSFIESMTIDAAYTNLQVGVITATPQVGRWAVFDHYQSGFEVLLDLVEVTDGITGDIEITTDGKFIRSGNPEPDSFYVADAPFAGFTATQNELLLQTPAIAARVKATAGTAGVLRARFLQSGGGYR
jgi:hypothetical protein